MSKTTHFIEITDQQIQDSRIGSRMAYAHIKKAYKSHCEKHELVWDSVGKTFRKEDTGEIKLGWENGSELSTLRRLRSELDLFENLIRFWIDVGRKTEDG